MGVLTVSFIYSATVRAIPLYHCVELSGHRKAFRVMLLLRKLMYVYIYVSKEHDGDQKYNGKSPVSHHTSIRPG